MIVEIALAAENDLADGFWFYEHQHTGLAHYFRVNLAADIESLALNSGIHEIELGFHVPCPNDFRTEFTTWWIPIESSLLQC